MANNSKANGKRGRGRPPKVVKYHKTKRQYFATLQVGGRTAYFYGATEPEVLEKYTQRREQLQRPIRGLTDEEADAELLSAGVPEEVVADNPELRRVVKRGALSTPRDLVTRPSTSMPPARVLQDHLHADHSAGPRHSGAALVDLRASWVRTPRPL